MSDRRSKIETLETLQETYLAPFRRYVRLIVENCQFVRTPVSFNALARVTSFELRDERDICRN